MATKRISDLTAVNLVSGSAILPVVQDGATVKVTFADLTGSIAGLGGTAVTASYALTAETASYAVSASYEISYETSSSYAETADVAISASYAQTATTAAGVYKDSGAVVIGNAIGDISVDGLDTTVVNITALGSAVITGSLDVNGRAKFNGGATGSFSGSFEGDGSGLTGITATLPAGVVSGSAQIDGSQIANNVINLGNTSIALGNTPTVPQFLNGVNLFETKSSGSFSGSFEGDGSGLTGVTAVAFPYTGSAGISGSLAVNGPATISGLKISRGLNDNFSSLSIGDLSTLSNSTTGQLNVAIGAVALRDNTSGGSNIAIGYQSLQNNEAGSNNVAVGATALSAFSGSTGANVAVGSRAQLSNATGTGNVAVGLDAVRSNVGGNYNVGLGQNALYSSTGNFNTALGFNAGYNITSGASNVILGPAAGPTTDTSNKLFIHNSLSDNPLIYGDFSTRELTVNGDLIVTGSLVAQNGASGSFSGSFVGDGSGLTGVVATFAQQTLSANNTTIASTAILTAGSVNIVDTADVSNTAVRLASPTFGSVTHVVNTSDRSINVFPFDTDSAIFGQPSGSSVAVPNDGLMYTFTCIQNPGVGTWSFSTPTTQGGTSTQTRITLEETFNLTTISGSGSDPIYISEGNVGATSTYVTGGANAQCAVFPQPTSRVFWHPDFKNYNQISLVAVEILTNIPTGDITNASGDSVIDKISTVATGSITAEPIVNAIINVAQAYKDTYPGAPACSVGTFTWFQTQFDPNFNTNYISNNLINQYLAPHLSLPNDPGTTGELYQKYVISFAPSSNRQDIFDSLGYPRIYWHCAALLGSSSTTNRRQWNLGNGFEVEFKVKVTFELYK